MYTTYEVRCNVVITSMQFSSHKSISFQKEGGASVVMFQAAVKYLISE
jgi:hypothetical protein